MLLEGIAWVMTEEKISFFIRIFMVATVELRIFLPYYHRVTKNLL